MADDEHNPDELAETGPLQQDVAQAKTEALPSITEDPPTNPVQRSMLTAMSAMTTEEDETEFLRQSDVDASFDPTEEHHADELVGPLFEAETIDTGEEAALTRRGGGPPPDDSDVVTLETDEEMALQRRRRRPVADPPMTRPAVLLDAPQPTPTEPPTQPQPVITPPAAASQQRPPTRDKSAPFWKRESFWSPGQATRPADVLRVPLSEDEMSAREMHALKVALIGGFFGAVIALAIAMSAWMDPLALIPLALALVLPMAFATAWLSRPEDLSQVNIDDLRLLVRPIGAGAVLLLVFTLPWQFGFVRSLLRPVTANSSAMSVRILQDRSASVAIDECVRVAPNPQRVEALAAGLPGRVDVTRACFTEVTDQPDAAARDLLTAWRPRMIAPTVEVERACGMAESAAVLPLPTWELRSALVDCVVEGSADVQECCGKSLAALGDGEQADAPPPNFVPDEPAAASWLRLSLGELTPRQKKIRKATGLDSRQVESAAIDFACRAVDGGANMGPHFVASLKSCGIGPEVRTDRELWMKICASMRERHAAQQDRTKARALCDAAKARGAPLGAQPETPSQP